MKKKLIEALENLLAAYINNMESEYHVGYADDDEIVIETNRILEEVNAK